MRIPGPALVLPFLLAGCALPPAVTVASLVADGVSFATTGKGTADHAISAVANEDCALLRAVEGKAVCDPDGEVLIALERTDLDHENWTLHPEIGEIGGDGVSRWGAVDAQAAESDQPPTSPHGADTAALPAAAPLPAGDDGQLTSLDASPAAAKLSQPGRFTGARPAPKPLVRPIQVSAVGSQPEPATYAVIGSFRNQENAQRMVAVQGDDALIQTVVVGGSVTYRVLVDRPLQEARSRGFADAWPVRLCGDTLAVPPCGHFVVSQSGVYLASAAED